MIQRFDLKGATYGRRRVPRGADPVTHRGLQLDGDAADARRQFHIGPARSVAAAQLARDAEQLGQWWLYDYSLLIGVAAAAPRRRVSGVGTDVDNATFASEGGLLDTLRVAGAPAPGASLAQERSQARLRGWYRGSTTTAAAPSATAPADLYIGVIDTLTPYVCRRVVERAAKRTACLDREEVSACPPPAYGARFGAMAYRYLAT